MESPDNRINHLVPDGLNALRTNHLRRHLLITRGRQRQRGLRKPTPRNNVNNLINCISIHHPPPIIRIHLRLRDTINHHSNKS